MPRMAFTSLRPTAFGLAVLLLTTSVVLCEPAWSFWDTPEQRATLKGIIAVKVIVGTAMPLTLEESDVKALLSSLQTDVELRLRKAGITVNPSADSWLLVTMDSWKAPLGNYIFVIHVRFMQWLILPRASKGFFAPTWETYGSGSVGPQDLRSIRDYVGDNMDKFINAYLEQNPKQ